MMMSRRDNALLKIAYSKRSTENAFLKNAFLKNALQLQSMNPLSAWLARDFTLRLSKKSAIART